MKDTIDLLETIGRDASLRYAAGGELMQTLDRLGANGSLKTAICSGDRLILEQELGYNSMSVAQTPTQTGFEEDFEGESSPEPDTEDEEKLPF